jgi:hypothetical protein
MEASSERRIARYRVVGGGAPPFAARYSPLARNITARDRFHVPGRLSSQLEPCYGPGSVAPLAGAFHRKSGRRREARALSGIHPALPCDAGAVKVIVQSLTQPATPARCSPDVKYFTLWAVDYVNAFIIGRI